MLSARGTNVQEVTIKSDLSAAHLGVYKGEKHYYMFVDLEKAYDEMNPLKLSNVLCESGVDIWLLN